MKAAVIRSHGGLECVKIESIPDPRPAAGEVLIGVRAAGLNHLDIWVRKGGRAALAFPHVLGSDASGVVSALGPGTHGVRVGDEVVVNPALSCGCCEYCRRGEQSECVSFGIVGMARPGTFAEQVVVPAANACPKPAYLSFIEAAALPLAYVTAWRMLMTRSRLVAGETVLIHGIGGGVALAALQLAKRAGALAIVSSSSNEKLSRAIDLGADHTINYASCADLPTAIRSLTGGRGVDLVVDTVGASTWPLDFRVVRKGGRIVLCGVTTGPTAETDLRALYWNQFTVLGSTLGSDEDFRSMLKAVNAAKLKPVIDTVEPLDRAREAMARMESGKQFGKIVLEVTK